MAETQSPSTHILELTSGSSPDQIAAARRLLLDYGRFVVSHPAAARFCFGSLEEEAAGLPHIYTDLAGGCLLALLGNEPAGFVAWRPAPGPLAEEAWELKRLWVAPVGRGSGLGRRLTGAVIDRARVAGRGAVYLDTIPEAMGAAHRLYLDMGFVPCSAYNDNPVEHLAWLVKKL
ncbi:MAG TPA: GNAT family N-acetyltransferase [Terracidiphilus sp.]|jgi:GNAT superfamily N-acetyltransferase